MSRRRVFLLVPVVAAMAAALPAAAGAAGAGAQQFQFNLHDGGGVEYDYQPCAAVSQPDELTFSNENAVLHFTALANGTDWGTGTFEGDVTARPILNDLLPNPDPQAASSFIVDPASGPVVYDTGKPTYTGHFTTWFGENDNLRNGNQLSTFHIHAVGSDGSTIDFQETAVLSVDANQNVRVSFDNPRCV